jgi:sarcosine oxidase, subunit gamma
MPEAATRNLPAVPAAPWLQALPPALRYVLHGGAAARAAAAATWGPDFADQACRAVVCGSRATLWLGPDEYLLLEGAGIGAPAAADLQPAESLELALSGIPHALVDVSHRQFALGLCGPHAASILSGACPLDLDPGEFPVNMCTRTVFAKADIVLWRTGEETFHLEVWRSFAGYVTGLLRDIALEYTAE